jgi:hypothetical protein
MEQLLLYGALCALVPCFVASLHWLLGELTKPLIYLIALGQALLVPVLVAIDPNISFGSDAYSLGAGVSIMLIVAVESVFLMGTGLGVLLGTYYVNRREHAADVDRAAAMFSADPPAPQHWRTTAEATPIPHESPQQRGVDAAVPIQSKSQATRQRQNFGLILVGTYLCFILAMAGAGILIDGLSSGSFGWVRNFGAVAIADRPIAFVAVSIMYATSTVAAGWGALSLLSRLRPKSQQSGPDVHGSGSGGVSRR